ncbi:Protein disulfide-isomerase A6 [Durusdinium trenchii]|uniref:Protein disulfide-isomerase A6 n=1 Tax=Durusdinium trenchii TaxID=1381693 RepID=A0ABP0J694_9DINO
MAHDELLRLVVGQKRRSSLIERRGRGHEARKGRFAGAIASDESPNLAALDIKGDVLHTTGRLQAGIPADLGKGNGGVTKGHERARCLARGRPLFNGGRNGIAWKSLVQPGPVFAARAGRIELKVSELLAIENKDVFDFRGKLVCALGNLQQARADLAGLLWSGATQVYKERRKPACQGRQQVGELCPRLGVQAVVSPVEHEQPGSLGNGRSKHKFAQFPSGQDVYALGPAVDEPEAHHERPGLALRDATANLFHGEVAMRFDKVERRLERHELHARLSLQQRAQVHVRLAAGVPAQQEHVHKISKMKWLVAAAVVVGVVVGASVQELPEDAWMAAAAEQPVLVDFGGGKDLDKLAAVLAGTGIKVGKCSQGGGEGLQLLVGDKRVKMGKGLDVGQVVLKSLGVVRDVVEKRLPGKAKPNTKNKNKKKTKAVPVQLTDKTFDDELQGREDHGWMVAFVAPWCGHCQRLGPEWDQAAKELQGTGVVIATVDATANEGLSQRFGIQGFPTIKFFPPHGAENPVDYPMERSADAIVSWSLAEFERAGGKVSMDVAELTSQEEFDQVCEGGKCVIAFLPHLLDTGAGQRQALIDVLEDAQRGARHLGFGWVEAGAQVEWEAAYGLEFGFPAVLLLREHQGKQMGLVMRGSSGFTGTAIAAFASAPKKLGEFAEQGWPAIVETVPWDGLDAVPPEDDDDFDIDAFLQED